MLATLAAVSFLAIVADFALTSGRVHPGVSVGGVAVGGMTPAKAAEKLAVTLPEKSSAPVGVSYNGHAWTARPADLGITFDYNSLVATAMAYGRGSGVFGDIGQRAGAFFGSAALPARASADQAKLEAFIGKIAETTDKAPTDAGVTMKGMTAVVSPASSGAVLDRPQLTTLVLEAFTAQDRTIDAPVHVRPADVSDQAAEAARNAVPAMIALPATVTWGKQSWTLSRQDLSKTLDFRKVQNGSGWTLEPFVSPARVTTILKPRLGGNVGQAARSASFTTHAGVVQIIPARTGVGPDLDALSVALTLALKGPADQPRVVALHTRKVEPKLTTVAARKMGIRERISTYTTSYAADVKPRVNNIHVLGDALDGKLVAPGATFSFNGAIGERTAAKGYEVANVIVDGKLVQALGGGICQVGTTLFNTVFESGLPVIERHNHSFYISHYPTGRDATVSWGGPDLKFKNTTDNWILIATSYTGTTITISLYGVDPGYAVTSTTGEFYDVTPYPTQTVKDPKLPEGVKLVEDEGETGRTCVVTRVVKLGGEVVRTDTFKSVYKPKIEVMHVGTKKVAAVPKSKTNAKTSN
jgi:vancomycin resistance protein YoaR